MKTIDAIVKRELHKQLIEFAKEQPKIKMIFRGTSPEYPNEGYKITYWFLTGKNSEYDCKLEDEITKLDIKLHKTVLKKGSIGINSWPIGVNEIQDYGFLGECIYKK